ncbi:MAG: hypothetical protein ACE5FS_03350 [Paracoccaceae bacterium]
MTRPLAIDLFCGLFGWSDGLIAEGWRVVGFDLEDMCGKFGVPRPQHTSVVLQDVLTLRGSQFKDAGLIVASPPCTEYSYMAMPWSRGKQIARALRGEGEFPEGYTGSRTVPELNTLFDACFRIQREACAAAGHHIPMVVENVRGAIPWVGRSRWNHGSFHLWGDVPVLMPPVGRVPKIPGFRFDGSGGSFQTASVKETGIKLLSDKGRRTDPGKGARFTSRDCGEEGVKQRGSGREWFAGEGKISRTASSKPPARLLASAMIAKIPVALSRHIGRAYFPAPSCSRPTSAVPARPNTRIS